MLLSDRKTVLLIMLLLIYIVVLYQEKNKNRRIPELEQEIPQLQQKIKELEAQLAEYKNLEKTASQKTESNPNTIKATEETRPQKASYQNSQNSQKEVPIKKTAFHEYQVEANKLANELIEYIIQPQDHIWKIIRKIYETDHTEESGRKIYQIILDKNKELQDPNQLRPGSILYLPNKNVIQKSCIQKA